MRLAIGVIVVLLSVSASVLGGVSYEPVVPEGYVGKVVLHIDYGTGPGEVRIMTPKAGDFPQYPWMQKHQYDRLSVSCLRVAGDRFYLIDNTSQKINLYRAPATFVWQTDQLENLHFIQPTPDGKVYAVWGAGVDKLSLIDETGKVVWTKEISDLLGRDNMNVLIARYGLRKQAPLFLADPSWTRQGLVTRVTGIVGQDENYGSLWLLVDTDGKLIKGLPGAASSSGTLFCSQGMDLRNKVASYRIVCRNEAGEIVNTIAPNFAASKCLGDPSGIFFEWFLADPADEGFVQYTSRFLPSWVPLTSFLDAGIERILLRVGVDGSLREEWKYASSGFESAHPALIVAPDGNVYHLKFTETGVDVVRYGRS